MSKKKINAVKGSEVAAEKKEKKPKVKFKYLPKEKKKKILVRAASVVLIAVLVFMGVFYLVKLLKNTVFKPNDIYYKSSYTVSDEKALAMKDVIVATAGEETLTNGLLKMFYWKRITNFMTTYSDYLSMVGLELTTPLDQQMAIGSENFTWQHYFIEGAISDWQRYVSLYKEGVKADIGLPADLKEDFDNLHNTLNETAKEHDYESVEALIADQIGVGVSYDDYRNYFEMYYLGLAYYNTVTEDIEVTMDEITEYFAENAAVVESSYSITKDSGMAGTIRYILLKPVDEDMDSKFSEAEWKDCLERAEETLQEWKDTNGTEEGFAQLAKNLSEDEKTKENGGLCEGVYEGYGLVDTLEKWAINAARQPGETDLVQTSTGYYIMYYVSGEEAWVTCSRELVRELKLADLLEEIMTPYTVNVNFKKVAIDDLILATSQNEEE